MEGVRCPCDQFCKLEDIEKALESSDETTDRLIEWISGGEISAFCGNTRNQTCANRVPTSLLIINSLRDATRKFLEVQKEGNDSEENTVQKPAPTISYEDEFPSLKGGAAPKGDSETLASPVASNHLLKAKKVKKRIRPATVSSTVQTAAWGQRGNLVNAEEFSNDKEGTFPSFSRHPDNLMSESRSTVYTTPKKSSMEERQLHPGRCLSFPDTSLRIESVQSVENDPKMERLARLYAALIQSYIVPSVLLEIHFLLRVLYVDESRAADPTLKGIQRILGSSFRCVHFSCKTFEQLSSILVVLGPVTEKLVKLDRFCEKVPSVSQKIRVLLQSHSATVSVHITHTSTAFLSLPFDDKRDSRHNFRTRDEQELFKNREETRDAFLYQLRSFLNVRGKILDQAQYEKSFQSIKNGSRVVVEGIRNENMNWFCGFFVELLLQIGPVPVEELDRDLLKLVGKDKLQKLHKRFTSKTASNPKSHRRVGTGLKRDSMVDPRTAARECFYGHQEFFYTFLLEADSFRLNYRLKLYLWSVIQRDNRPGDWGNDADKHVIESKILGRFLGLLVFSPEWSQAVSDLDDKFPPAVAERELDRLGINIPLILENAVLGQNSIISLFWVIDFLVMSTWSLQFARSSYFLSCATSLRKIQLASVGYGHSSPVSILNAFSFAIENFFADFVGLHWIARISLGSPQIAADGIREDVVSRDVTILSTWHSLSSHFEYVLSLVSILVNSTTNNWKSPKATRKLRPNTITTPISPSVSSDGNRNSGHSAQFSHPGTNRIEKRLSEAFFHRHHALKDICEFVIKQRLQHLKPKLRAAVPNLGSLAEPDDSSLHAVSTYATRSLLDAFSKDLVESLRSVIEKLGPEIKEDIVTEAISLAEKHGTLLASAIIFDFVQVELNQNVKSSLFGKLSSVSVDTDDAYCQGARMIESVSVVERTVRSTGSIQHAVGALCDHMNLTKSFINDLKGAGVSERDWRGVFRSILSLDEILSQEISQIPPDGFSVSLLNCITTLVTLTGQISSYGLPRTKRVLVRGQLYGI